MECLRYNPVRRALDQSHAHTETEAVSPSVSAKARWTKKHKVCATASRCLSHSSSVVRNLSSMTAMEAEPTLERPSEGLGQRPEMADRGPMANRRGTPPMIDPYLAHVDLLRTLNAAPYQRQLSGVQPPFVVLRRPARPRLCRSLCLTQGHGWPVTALAQDSKSSDDQSRRRVFAPPGLACLPRHVMHQRRR